MKKIITAINNPKLNEELKKENNFEIVCKDIQYKEAILEILEKNKKIDIIIISEQILGEINFENLIKKIKLINEKIKIIFILENKNNNLEKILIKNNIKEIYYNNEINLFELIKIINKKEINMEEEIIKLKKIIEEKNINYNKLKNNYLEKNNKINLTQENLKNNEIEKKINNKKNKYMLNKIITFSGNYKSGKTSLALISCHYLSKKKYRVLLIDGDLEKQDLSFILKNKSKIYINKNNDNLKKKYKNKNSIYKNKKIKKIINNNLINFEKKKKLKIENIKNNYNKIKNKKEKIKINKFKILEIKKFNSNYKINFNNIKNLINLNIIKISNNFYFFSNFKSLFDENKIKNEEEIKNKIKILFFIIEGNFDFIIFDLAKNNFNLINKEILKISDKNLIVMEANLLGIKEINQLLEIYLEEWNINKKNIYIIENKSNIISINKKIIAKIILIENKICKIKENKKFLFLLDNYFKRNFLLKNKNIKKDINKIINIIKK